MVYLPAVSQTLYLISMAEKIEQTPTKTLRYSPRFIIEVSRDVEKFS